MPAGQRWPTVRPIGTNKKSPGLGVGASLDERKARGLGGLRDLPHTVSTPIAPIQFPHGIDVGAQFGCWRRAR